MSVKKRYGGTTRRRNLVGGALGAIIACSLLAGVGLAGASLDSEQRPSADRLPPDSFEDDGSVDLAKVPDLVAVEDDDGDVVGYAWKQDIFGTDAGPGPNVIDVWDVTGTERLGRVFPDGVGFLTRDEERSLGATPTQAPTPTAAIAPTTVVE